MLNEEAKEFFRQCGKAGGKLGGEIIKKTKPKDYFSKIAKKRWNKAKNKGDLTK